MFRGLKRTVRLSETVILSAHSIYFIKEMWQLYRPDSLIPELTTLDTFYEEIIKVQNSTGIQCRECY